MGVLSHDVMRLHKLMIEGDERGSVHAANVIEPDFATERGEKCLGVDEAAP